MKVLVIVDMQEGFTREKTELANEAAVKIIQPMAGYLKTHGTDYDYIVLTRDTHYEDYLSTNEGKYLPIPHTKEGSEGWRVVHELTDVLCSPQYAWGYLNKSTFGYDSWRKFFVSLAEEHNQLDDALTVDICGTVSEICVVSNALGIKTAMPEATVRAIKSLCAGITPEAHEAAFTVMKNCQVEVI